MNINKIIYLIIGLFALMAVSCEDNVNDWPVDSSHDRLFRTTKFAVEEQLPTSVTLAFNGVESATNYILEFSTDSLLFNNIEFSLNIIADTLTAYSKGAKEVNTVYHLHIDGLNGTTRYSVRLKALDNTTSKESEYSELTFHTPDEQIFTNVTPGTTSVTLNWQEGAEATYVLFGELPKQETDENGNPIGGPDTIWVDQINLTDAQKFDRELVINELRTGTNYIAMIYNNEARRGVWRFKTLGSASGVTIPVQAGDDINALLATQTGTVTLSFQGGQEYSVKGLTIPAEVTNLYMSGNAVGGRLPKLTLDKFVLGGMLNNLAVQYMDIVSDGTAQFMIELNSGTTGIVSAGFDGCRISEIPRSLIRGNNSALNMESITINNCIIKNVGLAGYGLLNIGSLASLKTITMTKNTMINIGDQIIDLRVEVDQFTFTQSTFCNYAIAIPKLFRIDRQPKAVMVTSSVFTGDNMGAKVNGGNSNYTWLSFAGCYLTSDFVENNNKFTDAQKLTLTSEELFVDPRNDDFHFKPELKFDGDGVVGDPRWWK